MAIDLKSPGASEIVERLVKWADVLIINFPLPVRQRLKLTYEDLVPWNPRLNWSVEAFIYLSLHGTYSALWLMKSALYPDRRFEEVQPLRVGIPFIFLPLAGYYLAPYFLTSRHVTLAPWVIGACLSIYTIGIFFHYVGHAQKFYTLRLKRGLIEDGLWGGPGIPIISARSLFTSLLPFCHGTGYPSACWGRGCLVSSCATCCSRTRVFHVTRGSPSTRPGPGCSARNYFDPAPS
jgi:hypothetical protein